VGPASRNWQGFATVAAQVSRDLALYADRTILYVPAKWPAASRPYDFSKSQINNAESYHLALKWLAQLKVQGPGLYGNPPRRNRRELRWLEARSRDPASRGTPCLASRRAL
jgi:hypothetical protein